jgi:hypothetical protein
VIPFSLSFLQPVFVGRKPVIPEGKPGLTGRRKASSTRHFEKSAKTKISLDSYTFLKKYSLKKMLKNIIRYTGRCGYIHINT